MEEGQKTQWPTEKGQEKFEDIKKVIRSHLSFHLWLLITSLVSSNFSCPFYFGHCVVCPSSIYGF
jgi:hypothetical protein